MFRSKIIYERFNIMNIVYDSDLYIPGPTDTGAVR